MQFTYTAGVTIHINVDARMNDSRYKANGKFNLGDGDKKAMMKKAIKLLETKFGAFHKPMYCSILRWNNPLGVREVVGVERFRKEKIDAELNSVTI
jgi:hypothetical protein